MATRPVRTCSNCGKDDHGVRLGLCRNCYLRQYRRGTTAYVPLLTNEERFNQKVNRDGPIAPGMDTPCWLYTGGLGPDAYGGFWWNGRPGGAHRFAYEAAHGVTLTPAECVCHRCDTPLCVRPEHLFIGTNLDNIADRDQKKRNACGERIGISKLTADVVREIRARHASGDGWLPLAAAYGVTPATIRQVVFRRTWRHVE